ncbi:cell division protein ZipA C-terminal FtsZ-binding domain-containing protein [Fastidiosibacter lacustris]|uniref:cell division protein ZipA C-terminal FtsZ-binding domain-containing protein n=1 Tax=Fastidiosibacter lacustris TaxID=2056695 RepID=UPI0013004A71|nr:cell division protein ZipA C-terminal FtsZ-binding domain-containing protein [Fastidiosibacter lacustris]
MAELTAIQEQEKTAKVTTKEKHKQSTKLHQNPKQGTAVTKVELEEDIKVDPKSPLIISDFEQIQTTYPKLEKGIAVYYISAPRGYIFNGEDLAWLFTQNGLIFNSELKRFELLTEDKDVLFFIEADEETHGFDLTNYKTTDYTCLLCASNLLELSQYYDVPMCFEYFSNSINQINQRLGGTLLNEHKRRFTSHDESGYKSHLKNLKVTDQVTKDSQ